MTPHYEKMLGIGLHFQDFVVEELYKIGLPIISYSSKEYQNMIGENKSGIEIKNDRNYEKTGNLYIEIAEKSNENNINYVLSGIYRNDNTWLYLIGDEKKIFVLSKIQLQSLHKNKKMKEVKTGTSKGFLLPVDLATRVYALKVIEPIKAA